MAKKPTRKTAPATADINPATADIRRNPKWSYDDIEFWNDKPFCFIMSGFVQNADGSGKRRYRLLLNKPSRESVAAVSAEYRDENGTKKIATFGHIQWGVKEIPNRNNPDQKIKVEDFVYVHGEKGNIFKSHSTPLVTIDPLNRLVSLFTEAYLRDKLDHPAVVGNILPLAVSSLIEETTLSKIKALVSAASNKTRKGTLEGELAKAEMAVSKLDQDDISDFELGLERFNMFMEHVSKTQPISAYEQSRSLALSDFETARKLSKI